MNTMTIEELRRMRKEMAHRKRRIIYNNDGDDYGGKPVNSEEFLARRTIGVENTHVDTISYCSAEAFTYLKCNLSTRPEFQDMWVKDWSKDQFLVAGRDHVEIILEFCRKHEIEFWASVRMNDTHDQWQKKIRTPFKSEHPERWLASPPDLGGGSEEKMFFVSEGALEHPERWVPRGSCGVYYGADYANRDVRDRMLEIVGSLCENYDFDGIELDFLRETMVFSNIARGATDAGDENRELMTNLIRQIRAMTEEVGLKRDRPFVIAIRVPDDPDLATAYGWDTRTWLKEGLIDILIAGESSRIRPWKELVEFGHSYNIPVYPCVIEIHGVPVIGNEESSIRGRALAAWAAGADGIYTFNHFNPHSPLWKELGDPGVLAGLDRITPVFNANATQIMGQFPRLPGVRRFLTRPPRLPLELPDGKKQTFVFEAGEDGPMVKKSATPHANVCLRFDLMEKGDRLTVKLNGGSLVLQSDVPAPGWITCKDAGSLLKWGDNTLEIIADITDGRIVNLPRLIDLQVRVTAQSQKFDRAADEETSVAPKAEGPLANAFFVTEKDILPPRRPVSGLQQWLLDELNFARPRVPGVYKVIREHFKYPEDSIERPLPGWDSLAILFDTEKMGQFFEKEMMVAFCQVVDASRIKSCLGLHAGPLAGSHMLAAIVVRSQFKEDLEYVAGCFGAECRAKGILSMPARFIRAEENGHLIPGAFAIILRGMLDKGVFSQNPGCWKYNLLTDKDLHSTNWRLE